MKLRWLIFSLLFVSCNGQFWLTPSGYQAFYQSKDGEFSCYRTKCCWPYKEKIMICTDMGVDGAIVKIKFVPEK